MAGLIPEPPRQPDPEPLLPHVETRAARVRRLLFFVPFAFPAWIRLRSQHPEAARRLIFPLVVNVVQSVLMLIVLVAALGLVAFRDAIVSDLSRRLIESGLVR
ncbi:MAG: hypothetical protein Q7W30_02190 [Coriobacteriia bacterium]|nr:hypothetical protein [Coriobacteriia bacterium]